MIFMIKQNMKNRIRWRKKKEYMNLEINEGKEKIGEIKYLEEEMDNSIYKEINEFLEQKNELYS